MSSHRIKTELNTLEPYAVPRKLKALVSSSGQCDSFYVSFCFYHGICRFLSIAAGRSAMNKISREEIGEFLHNKLMS